jgi:hypothetical protein
MSPTESAGQIFSASPSSSKVLWFFGWLRIAVAVPPVAGVAILGLVLSGDISQDVLRSGAATSTALIVGLLLIVIPPALYIANAERYTAHQTALEQRVTELIGAGASGAAVPSGSEAPVLVDNGAGGTTPPPLPPGESGVVDVPPQVPAER